MSVVVEAARHYLAAGWALVDLHSAPGGLCSCGRACGKSSGKHPRHPGWPARRPRAEDLHGNVGVILGAASNGLADIDLDCPEAIALADLVLPRTLAFGRASAPRAHRLAHAHGAVTRQFRAPDNSMLLELRANPADPDGEALQTVIPPSIHYSGEAIEWDPGERDAVVLPDAAIEIDAHELSDCAAHLAAGALIMRHAGERAARIALLGGRVPPLPRAALRKVREWVGVPDEEPRPVTTTRKRSGPAEEQASAYAAKYPAAIAHQGGHACTFRLAQILVHGFGLDDGAALRVLAGWNKRCDPEWSERELEHKIASARQHPVREAIAVQAGAT